MSHKPSANPQKYRVEFTKPTGHIITTLSEARHLGFEREDGTKSFLLDEECRFVNHGGRREILSIQLEL